jgi:hypothetical protein
MENWGSHRGEAGAFGVRETSSAKTEAERTLAVLLRQRKLYMK